MKISICYNSVMENSKEVMTKLSGLCEKASVEYDTLDIDDLKQGADIVFVIGSSLIICVFFFFFLKLVVSFYSKWAGGNNKKFFLISSLLISFLIVIQFSVFKFSYLQFDFMNSMDSYFVYDSMFGDVKYFDIKHPLYTVFAYPLYAFFKSIL